MNQEQALGILRIVLASLGTYALAKGITPSAWGQFTDSFITFLTALIPLVTAAWSYYAHTREAKIAAASRDVGVKAMTFDDKNKDLAAVASAADPTTKVTILICAAIFVLFCSHAYAQNRPKLPNPLNLPDPLGIAEKPLQGPITSALKDLAALLDSNFTEADALSTAIPDLQDGNGQQCWRTLKSAGEVFRVHPIPATMKLAVDIEAVRLLFMTANKVCASAQCTQVFADGANVGMALGPIPILSLNAICSKIPQIPLSAPVTPVTRMPTPQQ